MSYGFNVARDVTPCRGDGGQYSDLSDTLEVLEGALSLGDDAAILKNVAPDARAHFEIECRARRLSCSCRPPLPERAAGRDVVGVG